MKLLPLIVILLIVLGEFYCDAFNGQILTGMVLLLIFITIAVAAHKSQD